MGARLRDPVASFWERVDRAGECWTWTRYRNAQGYGQIRLWWRGRVRTLRAHRLAWEIAHGPIPAGLWVLHHCDNPPCCRPDHLYLGTHADNVADKIRRGRTPLGRVPWNRGVHSSRCKHGHAMTPENTHVTMRDGRERRNCRECGRAASRRHYKRKAS